MKSHELAKKLLEQPDLDVYYIDNDNARLVFDIKIIDELIKMDYKEIITKHSIILI